MTCSYIAAYLKRCGSRHFGCDHCIAPSADTICNGIVAFGIYLDAGTGNRLDPRVRMLAGHPAAYRGSQSGLWAEPCWTRLARLTQDRHSIECNLQQRAILIFADSYFILAQCGRTVSLGAAANRVTAHSRQISFIGVYWHYAFSEQAPL